MAWFQKVGLPNPAAIGIFCASTQSRLGDSGYTAPLLGSVITVRAPVPAHWAAPDDPYYEFPQGLAYFSGASPHDPLVCPSASPAVLAKFPPTLLIVGSRDVEDGASLTHPSSSWPCRRPLLRLGRHRSQLHGGSESARIAAGVPHHDAILRRAIRQGRAPPSALR